MGFSKLLSCERVLDKWKWVAKLPNNCNRPLLFGAKEYYVVLLENYRGLGNGVRARAIMLE